MSDAPAEPLEGEQEEQPEPLSLEVNVEQPGTCQRHITVTVPESEIERYLKDAIDEMVPKAEVPGFRPGKAPRKLVASRFKPQVQEQVKGSLLMDSMQQVTEQAEFSAISEPDFDYNAVTLPETGPLTFEFDIEVRPEFDLPNWKGLKIERTVKEVDDEGIEKHLKLVLQKYGKTIAVEGGAEPGDTLVCSIFFARDGKTISSVEDEEIKIRPTLSFANAEWTGFEQQVLGAAAGSEHQATLKISDEDADEQLQGAAVEATIKIDRVERRELPTLSPAFLEQLGGFDDEEDLRNTIRSELERQLAYHQQRRVREQISAMLTESASWDLPPAMLRRQASRELERAVMELESSGFTMEQINTHANELRRNSLASTAAALKEHFILERLAEELQIEAEPNDYEREIELIAQQRDEPVRRVRARMEKRGQMDTLRNQIIERRVIEAIAAEAEITDVPFEEPPTETFAVSHAIGHRAEIPAAEHGEAESLRQPAERG